LGCAKHSAPQQRFNIMADCNAAAHEREREEVLELVIQLRLKHYEAELRKEKLEFEFEALDAEQKGGGLIQRGRLMALEDARNAYGGVDAGGQSAPVCVVCMDAQANMSFIHGNTAHMACCESCAQPFIYALTYFQGLAAGDTDDEDVPVTHTKCPLCRRDINKIVKQF